jgi:hypothetical protein
MTGGIDKFCRVQPVYCGHRCGTAIAWNGTSVALFL